MLSEAAIVQININLGLCDTYLLNTAEIDYQNALGSDPTSVCEYWDTTQDVLNDRAVTDTTIQTSLEVLLILSGLDGCTITLQTEPIPAVNIPNFGGGLL